jgi:hypothetical protein
MTTVLRLTEVRRADLWVVLVDVRDRAEGDALIPDQGISLTALRAGITKGDLGVVSRSLDDRDTWIVAVTLSADDGPCASRAT